MIFSFENCGGVKSKTIGSHPLLDPLPYP